MKLSKQETDFFYKLCWGLFFYVNQKHQFISNLTNPDFKDRPLEMVSKIHDKAFGKNELIDQFVSENPLNFTREELEIVKSWKNFIKDKFFIVAHLKEGTIFLKGEKQPKAFAVCGLFDDFKIMFPYLPVITEAVLLPFNKKIIYSGIMRPYNMTFGRNFRENIKLDFQKAKSKFGIITSLEEPISEREENNEELLKFYASTADNRANFEEEINKILKNNPELQNIYWQEVSKSNSRKIRKQLKEIGIKEGTWIGVLNETAIASGASAAEVSQKIKEILPEEKKKHAYIFRYK
ncbi:MAG: hypothetical protein HYW50_02565 [Candidatus Diapherotrites archaeon]|nr:hypothetical protein [Candidatus Diapherotrites archaeon]